MLLDLHQSPDNNVHVLLEIIFEAMDGPVETSAIKLTLTVLVMTIDALGHFETG